MKLIDKDALVAEIEKRYETNIIGAHNAFRNGKIEALREVKDFIDTLEVKEVDSEKVFLDEYSRFSNDTDAMDYAFPIDLADYRDFAEHFFELGMQVSNKAQKGEKI